MIALLVLLILLSASLSATETALFSLSLLTLKSYRNASSLRLNQIAEMMQNPRDILVTILILNILANILIQNTVSTLFGAFEGWGLKIGVPLALTLVFGEVLPKSFALPNHLKVAYWAAPWIRAAAWVLRPIRAPLTRMTGFISRFLFSFLREEKEISAEELRLVLKTSEERGILMPIESELVGGILDLQNSAVKEHLRPREEVYFYDIQEPLEQLFKLFTEKKVSRVPICEQDLENLKGVLSVKEYFFHQKELRSGHDLLPILKKPYYIPESMRGWTALLDLRERGVNLAIVVDEYGSISGLITQEDLAEAVIGEIADSRDTLSSYTRSSEDVIIASGKLELHEFEEIFQIPLKSKENIVTLGGWLVEQLGDIPLAGTKYATDDFLFYVLAAEPNRIRRIYVRRLKK